MSTLMQSPMRMFQYQWLLRAHVWLEAKLEYILCSTVYMVNTLGANVANDYLLRFESFLIFFINAFWTYFGLFMRIYKVFSIEYSIHFTSSFNQIVHRPLCFIQPSNFYIFHQEIHWNKFFITLLSIGKKFSAPVKVIGSQIRRGFLKARNLCYFFDFFDPHYRFSLTLPFRFFLHNWYFMKCRAAWASTGEQLHQGPALGSVPAFGGI